MFDRSFLNARDILGPYLGPSHLVKLASQIPAAKKILFKTSRMSPLKNPYIFLGGLAFSAAVAGKFPHWAPRSKAMAPAYVRARTASRCTSKRCQAIWQPDSSDSTEGEDFWQSEKAHWNEQRSIV